MFIAAGEIILTRTIEGEFTAGYDLFVYVSDGKTTTGPRSLTIHILGKTNLLFFFKYYIRIQVQLSFLIS